jgi:hypothetical protein
MEIKSWTVLFFSVMLGVATLTHIERHEANTAKHEVVQNTNDGNHNNWQDSQAGQTPASVPELSSDVTRPSSGRNHLREEDTLEELGHQKTSAKITSQVIAEDVVAQR